MTRHVIVDGSNLATEGRSMPSLTQLNEAVLAFMAEHPHDTVTVVVDATFGHRIEASEVDEFNEAVANNELVAPPAGAVGRGDAFVLSIANKVGGVVLSNDSFQEFHPEYPWLFDEGRLVGGKPVPHVGWVFVARTPVRGPVSRRATKDAKARASGRPVVRRSSKAASQPMPVPKAPPPRASFVAASDSPRPKVPPAEVSEPVAPKAAVSGGDWVNELLPFLDFAQDHPVGAVVEATVESYSSHGAYVIISEQLRGYVPLRLMGDPQPRSARSVLGLGDRVTLEVASYNPARRSVDLALRAVVPVSPDGAESTPSGPSGGTRAASKRSGRGSRRRGDEVTADSETPSHREPTESSESTVPSTTTAAAPVKKATAKKVAARKAPATKSASKARSGGASAATTARSSGREDVEAIATGSSVPSTTRPGAPVKKMSAKKAAGKPAVEEKTPKKAPASTVLEPAPARTVPVKKARAKKVPAPKAVAKKAVEEKPAAPAKKALAKKAPAKKVPAKKAPATKAPATKVPAKEAAVPAPAKKVPAKKAPVKKVPAKKGPAKKSASPT